VWHPFRSRSTGHGDEVRVLSPLHDLVRANRDPVPDGTKDTAVQSRRWWVLGVLCIALLVVVIDNTILNVALPTMQRELHATQAQEQWFIDAYTLVFAALLFTGGVAGDRWGRRRVLFAGMLVFGIGSALSAFSVSPSMLIGSRALMGVGGAMVQPSTLSIIQNTFKPSERGKAIGVWAGITGLAVAIGPIGGGALLLHFWWGSVFLVNVPIVLIGLVAIVALVPESKDPEPRGLDPYGIGLSIAGLFALVYGIIRGGDASFGDPTSYGAIVLGVAILTVFVVVERRSADPSLDMTLFRFPAFSAACAALTMAFFALFGVTFFLTFYLQFVREYSPFVAGLCFTPVAVALAIFAPRSDALVRRVGAKVVCTSALLLVAAAFGIYQLVDAHTSIWVIELILLMQGVGMANVVAPATNSLLSVVPQAKAGAGAAVNNTVRQVGGALGVAVVGSVLASTYASHLGSTLSPLPPKVRSIAEQSIGATVGVAQRAPANVRSRVVPRADAAYVSSMHDAAYVSAGAAVVGAIAVLGWLPGRDGGGEPYPASRPSDSTRARGGSRRGRRRSARRAPATRS
jgi:DHA2 family multidrug resistance protein-like MFS transporter